MADNAFITNTGHLPTVTQDQIEGQIVEKLFFTGGQAIGEPDHPSLSLLTICVLVLRNGFTVVGHSACAHPQKFDAELGRNISYSKAIEQMWPLLGYELKTHLYNQQVEAATAQAVAPAPLAVGELQAEGHDAVGTGPAEAALLSDLETVAEEHGIDTSAEQAAANSEDPFGENGS